ncbi:MAG TPA: hypothetical protein VFI55_16455, partial [Mycobacterium sp.]|nr:hypothetical protein [Mycobacterium sp.]
LEKYVAAASTTRVQVKQFLWGVREEFRCPSGGARRLNLGCPRAASQQGILTVLNRHTIGGRWV